jgi:hypothetical protein
MEGEINVKKSRKEVMILLQWMKSIAPGPSVCPSFNLATQREDSLLAMRQPCTYLPLHPPWVSRRCASRGLLSTGAVLMHTPSSVAR